MQALLKVRVNVSFPILPYIYFNYISRNLVANRVESEIFGFRFPSSGHTALYLVANIYSFGQ